MEENKQKEVVVQFVDEIGKGVSVCEESREIRVFSFLVDTVGASKVYTPLQIGFFSVQKHRVVLS